MVWHQFDWLLLSEWFFLRYSVQCRSVKVIILCSTKEANFCFYFEIANFSWSFLVMCSISNWLLESEKNVTQQLALWAFPNYCWSLPCCLDFPCNLVLVLLSIFSVLRFLFQFFFKFTNLFPKVWYENNQQHSIE